MSTSNANHSHRSYDTAKANAEEVLAQREADMQFMEHVDAFASDAVIARRAGITPGEARARCERIAETESLPVYAAEHFLSHPAGTAMSCTCDGMFDLLSIDYWMCGPELCEALHRQGLVSTEMLERLRLS